MIKDITKEVDWVFEEVLLPDLDACIEGIIALKKDGTVEDHSISLAYDLVKEKYKLSYRQIDMLVIDKETERLEDS